MSTTTKFLEELSGPLSLLSLLEAIREGEELNQSQFAKLLGVSGAFYSDFKKGHKKVSIKRAVQFAKTLGYSVEQFKKLAVNQYVE